MSREKQDAYKLLKDIINNAVDLGGPGISELAWNKKDAIIAINRLCESSYAILGGDVYIVENNEIKSAYDNWYINQNGQHWEDFVQLSKKKAISFIESYHELNGNEYHYSLVFKRHLRVNADGAI